MTEQQKKWIDAASYEQLLRKWRFAKTGEPLLQGDAGAYYSEQMNLKRKQLPDGEHTATSKRIGWNN